MVAPGFPSAAAEVIYRLRWTRLGLSQAAFAERYGVPYATVQNIEQGRGQPKPLARLILTAIELEPDLMARAAKAAIDWPSQSRKEAE
jgi:putative transcriptional regulator